MEPKITKEEMVVDLDKDSPRYGEKAIVIEVLDGQMVVEYEDGKRQTITNTAPQATWEGLSAGDFVYKAGLPYLVFERLTNTVLLSNPGDENDVGQWALINTLRKTGYTLEA